MAYRQSAATLNLLRAFAQGGYANLEHVHEWMLGFVERRPQSERYQADWPTALTETLRFMRAIGSSADDHPQLRETEFYTSHEALLLGYEAGADPRRFNEWRLLRHLRSYALDWRPDPPAGSCPCRILPRHQEPDRPEMRPFDFEPKACWN